MPLDVVLGLAMPLHAHIGMNYGERASSDETHQYTLSSYLYMYAVLRQLVGARCVNTRVPFLKQTYEYSSSGESIAFYVNFFPSFPVGAGP